MMRSPIGRGAAFHVFGGRSHALEVLRELRAQPADFLVVRRATKTGPAFHAFPIGEALLQRLRRFRRRDLTGALALSRATPAVPDMLSKALTLPSESWDEDLLRDAAPASAAVVLGLSPDGRQVQAVLARGGSGDSMPVGDESPSEPIRTLGDPWADEPAGVDGRPAGPTRGAAAQRTLWWQLRTSGPVAPAAVLRVALELSAQAVADGRALTVTFPEGRPNVDLHAVLSSRDFEPPDGESWSQRFVIDRRHGATPTSAEFRARLRASAQPGDTCALLVTLLCLGSVVGVHELRLVVGADTGDAPERPAPMRLPAEQGAPFVVMLSAQAADYYRPRLYARGELICELDPQTFRGATLFPLLKPGASDTLDEAAEALRAQVSGDLYDFLQGDTSTRDQPLLIVSADSVLPFEALRVGRSGQHALFLGAERPLCRWILNCRMNAQGRQPARQVVLLDGITPDLEPAQAEAKFLEARFPGLSRVADASGAAQLLERDAVGLVHFVGHAGFDSAHLRLADGTTMKPTFFDRDRPLLQSRPVFFLNGCSVGRGGEARPVSQGHFARALVQSGAAAVVAPQVDVVSAVAQEAARVFYESGSRTVAQAAQQIRRRAYEATADIERGTLLSYAAYAPATLGLDLAASAPVVP